MQSESLEYSNMVSQEMLTIKLHHHPFQFTDHQLNRTLKQLKQGLHVRKLISQQEFL